MSHFDLMLTAALAYAKSGKRIFPCHPATKKPCIKEWQKLASADEKQIRKWWRAFPKAMIGLPTGAANGIVVIDCDEGLKDGRLREGIKHFHALCQDLNHDPEKTLYAKTPTGGRHYYFQNPTGTDIRNSTSQLAPDVDVRGNGGYVIAPPSVNSEGGRYEWVNDVKPQGLNLDLYHRRDVPAAPVRHSRHCSPVGSKYGAAALRGEINNIAQAKPGTRNDALNQSSFRIGQLVESCGLDAARAADELIEAGLKTGLPFTECEKTVQSGLNKGMENPRVIEAKELEGLPAGHGGPMEGEEAANILPRPPDPPLEAFPLPVREVLKEAAAAYAAPAQIPVACLLGLLASLVGRTRAIRLKPGWREHGVLWLAIVARSGAGKSPVQSAFFDPLENLEHEAKVNFDKALSEHEKDLEVWKVQYKREIEARAKGEKLFQAEKPVAPVQKQVIADDATPEAIGDMLKDNPKGVILLKDELSGLFYDLDKYTGGGGSARSRIISAYDGKRWKTTRSSNPRRNLDIPKACLSIFGGIQPRMLARVFETGSDGRDIESGLLPRFIFVRAEPDKPPYWNEDVLSPDSRELLERITSSLWQWDIEVDEAGREIEKTVTASAEAKELFVEWHNAIANEVFISETPSLLDKLRAQAMRLCLLLHCLDASLAGTDGMEPVSLDCMRRALLLADWIKENQTQCWRLFESEKAHIPDPIERAIMDVCIEHKDQIAANGDMISNAELARLVREHPGMEGLSADKIGRAAARLGLSRYRINSERGWRVKEEEINLFLKNSVTSVTSVTNPEVTRLSGRDTSENVVSLVSRTKRGKSPEGENGDTSDTSKNKVSRLESGVKQGEVTLVTLVTLNQREKNKIKGEKDQVAGDPKAGDKFEFDKGFYNPGEEVVL